jgi:hypothetical protein
VNENDNRSDIAADQSPHATCNTPSTETSTSSEMETEIERIPHCSKDISLITEATQIHQNICSRYYQPCDLCATNTNRLIAEFDTEPQQLQNKNEDVMDSLTESFELEGNQNSNKCELEHIISAVGVQTQSHIPVCDLRCRVDPINEYETKHLMQFCFPTLFPDGYGGYKPLEEESRLHDHGLSDFCAHLMKWHDR